MYLDNFCFQMELARSLLTDCFVDLSAINPALFPDAEI